ncbi:MULTISPECIES: acyl-CoA thioesterase domain-containing protein [Pseudomonas]|uniref:acyl-CoA thioesterase n=1 Tax=Pseudomonas TaxID=286 RepID=UPI00029ABE86|nr:MULTISPECIES: acyl-CoA thioesterase domain-containing protein [Pseudomonas]MBF4208343.1 thioesterase family protein [Pseudomonas donghuensis]MBS7596878.1 thioesterase family protein [Pseudomonas sp. RC2C2]MCP3749147.1 thioesterase family protein [Pseudomonas sp. SBB6]MCP6698249.1 thioesterase family protein [Pseudomonas donghuensis]PJY96448.1 acyl-CoA thioesterase II [Pseudomonas donghuensis]
MNFSQLLTAVRQHPQAVTIDSSWAQGRACFGGLMAALVYEAMLAKTSPGRPVRSLAITFVGPAEPEVPISFDVELLREGKAVSSLLGRATQNGQVVTLIQGSFGAGRDSVVDVPALPAVEMKSLQEAAPELPYIKGITPEFMRHLALRWAVGGLPFSNTPSRSMGGWVRLRGDVKDEPVSEAHLLALVDAWPPTLLPYLSKPAAGSTLTWTIEFVQPVPSLSTLDWCRYCAQIDHARDGYGHASAALWSASGELLAISRQTVSVFA